VIAGAVPCAASSSSARTGMSTRPFFPEGWTLGMAPVRTCRQAVATLMPATSAYSVTLMRTRPSLVRPSRMIGGTADFLRGMRTFGPAKMGANKDRREPCQPTPFKLEKSVRPVVRGSPDVPV
jgi:hypothetical protein